MTMRKRARIARTAISMSASGFPDGEIRVGLVGALDVMVKTLRDGGDLADDHAANVLHDAAVRLRAGEDASE